MKIEINERVSKTVYLEPRNVKEITSRKLRLMLGHGEHLRADKNNKLIITKDDNHYHGSISESYVRDATELDVAIFTVLDALNKE